MITRSLSNTNRQNRAEIQEQTNSFIQFVSRDVIGFIGRDLNNIFQNVLNIYLSIYNENREQYYLYHSKSYLGDQTGVIQLSPNEILTSDQYRNLYEALFKKYLATDAFITQRSDPSIMCLMSQVIEDKIISKLQGSIEIEQYLTQNYKAATQSAPLALEFQVIRELDDLLPPVIQEQESVVLNQLYIDAQLLIEQNNNFFIQTDVSYLVFFKNDTRNRQILVGQQEYFQYLRGDIDFEIELEQIFTKAFQTNYEKANAFLSNNTPFTDFQNFRQLGIRLEKIDSYREYIQVLQNSVFQSQEFFNSFGQENQLPRLQFFIEDQIGGEITQDEYFQDIYLMNSLICALPQTFSVIVKNTGIEELDDNLRYHPLYVCAALSGYLSLYIEQPSTFIVLVSKILIIMVEVYITQLRTNYHKYVLQLVVTFSLIKLKTLFASKFYAEALKQGISYSNTVQLYIYKFVISRAFEILDFHVFKIIPLFTTHNDTIEDIYVDSQFFQNQQLNQKQKFDEHILRLSRFAKARNNLIQLLDTRLPQLKELFSRHRKARIEILKLEQAATKRNSSLVNLLSNRSQIEENAFTQFDASDFWTQAFNFIEKIYTNPQGVSGNRKIRLMEIIFIDWGTMRILSQSLQNAKIDNDWKPSYGSDNYNLLYGPSNALLFYGYKIKPHLIFPDLDETTLAYDIREMLRPDTQTEASVIYRNQIISDSILQTVKILGSFVEFFGTQYTSLSTSKQLQFLDNYADLRFRYLMATLYLIEFFGPEMYEKVNTFNATDNQFLIYTGALSRASLLALEGQKVIEQELAAGQVQEATVSKLAPDNSKMEVEQINLSKRRQIALLVKERDRLTDVKEAKFYLNYIQINSVARLNAAIYSSFVKNSLRGPIKSDLNLNSPLLLENTMEILQQSTKKLVNLGVIKLFDLQASFYKQVKYKLINDDMQIFLSAANRKEDLFKNLQPSALERETQLALENRNNNLSQQLRENRLFREELIQQLVTQTNEQLQPLLVRVQNIEKIYQQEVENAQLIELEIRRSLQEPLISDRSEQILLRALEETELVGEQMDEQVQQFLKRIEEFNKIMIELNANTKQEPEKVDFSQFFSVRDDFLTTLNSITFKMRDFLFTGSAPIDNSDGQMSEEQLSKFIDLHFQRIASAVKTRMTTRQSRDFVQKLGANGQIRLNSILSNPDLFLRQLRVLINEERTLTQENREITNLIAKILEGARGQQQRLNVEQFIKTYIKTI